MGECSPSEIPTAFTEGMKFLCELHAQTGTDDSGIYLPSSKDRQVGLGVLGLANHLAIAGVTYKEFVETLEDSLDIWESEGELQEETSTAKTIVNMLFTGFKQSAEVARQYKMQRAFTIAPTASCSYNYQDIEGYTTTPEIAPPVDRQVDRDSDTFGVQSYDYNPKVEIASEVGWDIQFRLNAAWQRLMNTTGLAHSISMNWWSDMVQMDKAFIERWLDSPLLSLYYSLQVMPATQDKSSVFIDEDFSILGLGSTAEDESPSETKGFCSACAE
jgi:hypothetical protein